ncbi:hypothetical protein [Neobacillus kokaensis]|uniref:Uncharacterized protein n=1 Tax=Neobacillus kokaensis TaxID=2759023 RepID=A0ABQ3N159_9BACI|nr:hypothetical protein [Neobacillus kokaensis]GHH98660.1 hypothetical protein AM1BK_22030 [Neobacillus kokaensis]
MKSTELKINHGKITLGKVFFYFVIIDVLFLPYFKYFVMPNSLIFVVIWTVINIKKIKTDFDFKVFIILFYFVLLSSFVSYFFTPHTLNGYSNIWGDNIKRPFQLLSSFLYYFYLKTYLKSNSFSLKKILLLFILFADILALISILNIGLYFDIKEMFSVRDPFIDNFFITTDDYFFRYSYLWVDPNSIGYIIGVVGFYLMINEKLSSIQILFVIISMLLILITCMSSGALLAVSIVFVLLVGIYLKRLCINFSIKIKKKEIFSLLISICILLIVGLNIETMSNLKVFNYGLDRIFGNSSESRKTIYQYIITNKNMLKSLFIGNGYTLIVDNAIKRPHSDHLRIIYGYGWIAYLSIILFLFRKRKGIAFHHHFFLIPGFVAFSINSLIDEQKVFVVFLILLAATVFKKKVIRETHTRGS